MRFPRAGRDREVGAIGRLNSLVAFISLIIEAKSASAFLTHSAVSARIKDPSFAHHIAHEPIVHLDSHAHRFWTADDEIEGIISRMDPVGDLRSRAGRVLVRSDDYH